MMKICNAYIKMIVNNVQQKNKKVLFKQNNLLKVNQIFSLKIIIIVLIVLMEQIVKIIILIINKILSKILWKNKIELLRKHIVQKNQIPNRKNRIPNRKNRIHKKN